MFQNLLTNAIKFTHENGHVTLTAVRLGDEIVVDVGDDGCGIAAEFLPHVFELFTQSEERDGSGERGLGLGLAIARELVALHDGVIEAHSEGLGRGASFRVRLPATQQRVAPKPQLASVRALADISILLVDDDPRVLSALELLLGRAGAHVQCAESVAAAWSLLERAAPDIIVSDIAMPGADGHELVRRLRASPLLGKLPALALSAHATAADADRALAEGYDGHLAKPIEIDVLVASISRLVRRFASPSVT